MVFGGVVVGVAGESLGGLAQPGGCWQVSPEGAFALQVDVGALKVGKGGPLGFCETQAEVHHTEPGESLHHVGCGV